MKVHPDTFLPDSSGSEEDEMVVSDRDEVKLPEGVRVSGTYPHEEQPPSDEEDSD